MSALYDSGLHEDDLIIQSRLPERPFMGEVGSIVAYKLLPKDNPANPHKIWTARIVSLYQTGIMVEMLEPGYAHLQEFVLLSQIVAVE